MARARIYENAAEKQRVYRARIKEQEQGAEALHYARLEKVHRVIQRAAADGIEAAAKMLGKTPSDTALRIITHTQSLDTVEDNGFLPVDLFGFSLAYYAYEEAASDILLERSGQKDGVFRVMLAPEPRKRKAGNSQADRPTASSPAKRKATAKGSTHRNKKPLNASPVPAKGQS